MKTAWRRILGLGALWTIVAGCIGPADSADTGQFREIPDLRNPERIQPLNEVVEFPQAVPLVWTRSPGAVLYEVYFGRDPNPPLAATLKGTSLVVRDLPPCTIHYWRVVAIGPDEIGISSPTWQFETACD